jgi:hypothetical protein
MWYSKGVKSVPTKEASSVLSPLLNTPASALAPSEVVIGALTAIDTDGRALVSFCLGEYTVQNVAALSTQIIDSTRVGRQVALLFAAGNQQQPVIMGFIHSPLDLAIGQTQEPGEHASETKTESETEIELFPAPTQAPKQDRSADLNGKRLVFEAEEEVQIKCGEASINLYKDGRVVIRGRNLISRASVVNRILGGSVQVN